MGNGQSGSIESMCRRRTVHLFIVSLVKKGEDGIEDLVNVLNAVVKYHRPESTWYPDSTWPIYYCCSRSKHFRPELHLPAIFRSDYAPLWLYREQWYYKDVIIKTNTLWKDLSRIVVKKPIILGTVKIEPGVYDRHQLTGIIFREVLSITEIENIIDCYLQLPAIADCSWDPYRWGQMSFLDDYLDSNVATAVVNCWSRSKRPEITAFIYANKSSFKEF